GDDRARLDVRTAPDGGPAGQARVVRHAGLLEHEELAWRVVQGGGGQRAEHDVARAADERLRRPDVQPVRVLGVAHDDRLRLNEAREGLPLDGYHLAGRDLVDHGPAEDVTAG